jgi:hypothetical protein
VAQVVEHLPSKHKSLNLNPGTASLKKEKLWLLYRVSVFVISNSSYLLQNAIRNSLLDMSMHFTAGVLLIFDLFG